MPTASRRFTAVELLPATVLVAVLRAGVLGVVGSLSRQEVEAQHKLQRGVEDD